MRAAVVEDGVEAVITRCGEALALPDPYDPVALEALVRALLSDLAALISSGLSEHRSRLVLDEIRKAHAFLGSHRAPRLGESSYDHLRALAWLTRTIAYMYRDWERQGGGWR
ncbi:hypothetical protein [Streptomyces sp. G45]|uniref:hypothetical protein n=1 Tax=Streptomyces sp. G45 TaxID=3406627 RepID=UPI003C28FB43